MANMLTKADIVAADDLKIEIIAVPEWGGSVRIKALSLGQLDELRERSETEAFKGKFGYLMLADSLVDEEEKPMFGIGELGVLGKKSVAALRRCMDACNRLNAQTTDAVAEAKND